MRFIKVQFILLFGLTQKVTKKPRKSESQHTRLTPAHTDFQATSLSRRWRDKKNLFDCVYV